ncbi:MAG: hypothetical protein AB7I42_29865 [Bradyrhizobium sp.]|uniref:hypothetical protein n=1 Tax=Bradyrhizobium sp. TaxID=376 RepID=UPI003D0E7402
MAHPIPLICDRCRASGAAGDDPFACYADLLDFAPVPRRPRADGWDGEVQRAFIAALAATGSARQAAHAVGRAQFGVDQLKKAKGNEGFMAAFARALDYAAEEKSRRLREGLIAVAGPAARWRPPLPAWGHAATRQAAPPPAYNDEAETEAARLAWLADLVRKYLLKVGQEREARLAGQVVAADFYLRQLTWLEVALDLMGSGGFKVLTEFRKGDHHLVDIAETPFSRILDAARREKWAALGEPPRPQHPPRDRLVDHDGFSTEPLEHTEGGRPESHEEQQAAFEAEHKRQAEAQIEWEAEARRDFERRRDSGADHNQEPGPAGQRVGEAEPD